MTDQKRWTVMLSKVHPPPIALVHHRLLQQGWGVWDHLLKLPGRTPFLFKLVLIKFVGKANHLIFPYHW